MADLADTIRTIPLFSGLSREDIAKILGRFEEKSYSAGMTIVTQGDKGDSFYIIQSGAVQVILESGGGRRESIAVLCPPNAFGAMGILSGGTRPGTVTTAEGATALML